MHISQHCLGVVSARLQRKSLMLRHSIMRRIIISSIWPRTRMAIAACAERALVARYQQHHKSKKIARLTPRDFLIQDQHTFIVTGQLFKIIPGDFTIKIRLVGIEIGFTIAELVGCRFN